MLQKKNQLKTKLTLRNIDVETPELLQLRCFYRSSHPEVFLVKGVLRICIKFTGEHPCLSVISIKLQSNFIVMMICPAGGGFDGDRGTKITDF